MVIVCELVKDSKYFLKEHNLCLNISWILVG